MLGWKLQVTYLEAQYWPLVLHIILLEGGCSHFITGAGGFLQGVYAGYGGFRIQDDSLTLNPVLPENTTYMKLRRVRIVLRVYNNAHYPLQMSYLGNIVDVYFNQTSIVFEVVDNAKAVTPLSVVDSAGKHTRLAQFVPVTIPRTGNDVSLVSASQRGL